jgi:hypothetical protein
MVPNLPCFFYGSDDELVSFEWDRGFLKKEGLFEERGKMKATEFQVTIWLSKADSSVGERK